MFLQVMKLLQRGNKERTTEPTAANKTSSRSHALLVNTCQPYYFHLLKVETHLPVVFVHMSFLFFHWKDANNNLAQAMMFFLNFEWNKNLNVFLPRLLTSSRRTSLGCKRRAQSKPEDSTWSTWPGPREPPLHR
jgi:hypothetical protein